MTKNVRDVRGCKRYLLHAKSLYSKALRGYLGNVRDISIIGGGEECVYTRVPPGPQPNIYLLQLHFSYI
jgi:hypothetical protein